MTNIKEETENCITATKSWLETFVIGMNFCPFAKVPFQEDRIEYLVEESSDLQVVAATVGNMMQSLVNQPPETVETGLIIVPNALNSFLEYLDFIDVVQDFLEESDLEGILQIASFHPQYQFANTTPEDAENYTNRSPFPMIHLLRENSVGQAVDHYPNVYDIPEKNIEKLEAIGAKTIKKMWNEATSTY